MWLIILAQGGEILKIDGEFIGKLPPFSSSLTEDGTLFWRTRAAAQARINLGKSSRQCSNEQVGCSSSHWARLRTILYWHQLMWQIIAMLFKDKFVRIWQPLLNLVVIIVESLHRSSLHCWLSWSRAVFLKCAQCETSWITRCCYWDSQQALSTLPVPWLSVALCRT